MNIFTGDVDELRQDKWSQHPHVFGSQGQLVVVGYFRDYRLAKGKQVSQKYYVLRCSICTTDPEMYGDGLFYTTKYHLDCGKIPCGCSRVPKWDMNQWEIRVKRVAVQFNYKFNHTVGEWKGQNTKVSLSCEDHGEWVTTSMGDLVDKHTGCPGCRTEGNRKPDSEMIASFLASGAFHPETKFWRSDEVSPSGWKEFWLLHCPICNETCRSRSTALQSGFLPCGCGGVNKQKECYINLVLDGGSSVVALKFGIANNSNKRLKTQNRCSQYEIQQHIVFKFPSVVSCKNAEKECKETLVCGRDRKSVV